MKTEEIKELDAKLDSFLESALTDKAELDRLASHYRITGLYSYSLTNQILIMMQGGTVCNSYKRWQAIGRQVRKGEKARISIIRPSGRRIKTTDPETGEEKEEYITDASSFYPCKVFDIEQTDGEPLHYDHNSDNNDAAAYANVKKACTALGWTVEEEILTGPRGYYSTDGKKLVVSSISNDTDKAKTLLHELAHVLLKHTGNHNHDLTINTKEVEAESTAFLCLAAFGIDFDLAADYVSAWGEYGHHARKREILKAASKILRAID